MKHRGFEEDEEKVQDVIQTIRKVQAETVQRKRPAGVGIVYCSYVETVRQAVHCKPDRQCKLVHASLRKNGIAAELYHAKMSDIEKEQVLEAWTGGRVPCIVATIAFGMVRISSSIRRGVLTGRVSTSQMSDMSYTFSVLVGLNVCPRPDRG